MRFLGLTVDELIELSESLGVAQDTDRYVDPVRSSRLRQEIRAELKRREDDPLSLEPYSPFVSTPG